MMDYHIKQQKFLYFNYITIHFNMTTAIMSVTLKKYVNKIVSDFILKPSKAAKI